MNVQSLIKAIEIDADSIEDDLGQRRLFVHQEATKLVISLGEHVISHFATNEEAREFLVSDIIVAWAKKQRNSTKTNMLRKGLLAIEKETHGHEGTKAAV